MSEISVRDLINSSWWETCDRGEPVAKGRLVWAFVPHVDQIPYALIPEERSSATEHKTAKVTIAQCRITERVQPNQLPVAALPQRDGERWIVQRAKIRPCIVVADGGGQVVKAERGGSKWQTAPTLLVAPAYGAEITPTRAGWNEKLVRRIGNAEYPQYMLDELPLKGAGQSVVRLDHIQPIGNHHQTHDATEYKLSAEATKLLDEWVNWYRSGALDSSSALYTIREQLMSDE